MTDALREKLLSYALGCVKDVSHGEGHLRRVLKNACLLAEDCPQADRDALCAAAILHDCAQAEQIADPNVHHAAAGAEKARAFLMELKLEPAFIELVCRIIAAHSSPKEAAKAGIEAQLLFDADKLDMCGAVGICRALMYALDNGEELYAEEGESLYTVVQNDISFAGQNLFTPRARQMAEGRLALSRAFLAGLENETRR